MTIFVPTALSLWPQLYWLILYCSNFTSYQSYFQVEHNPVVILLELSKCPKASHGFI